MDKCGTCKHWKKPADRADFGSNVVTYLDEEWDEKTDGYPRGDADDKLFGLCNLIDLSYQLSLDEPAPLAVTQDGSQYRADLFTQAEFGCVLHEEVVDGATPSPG